MALGYYMGGAPGGWWQQRDKSGGQLVEQTTHIVDTALYVIGDVKAVGPLEVRWPSGRVDTFQSVPIDCELFLVEGRRVLWRVPR